MALTRSELAELDEAQLRTRVLIPSFNAMGFRDIEHYHGGSQEHGKDIVMWRPEGLRERVNYGVVVKAKKVSGRASGTSSAGEVRIQIEQCFDKPYADPITNQEQWVDRCWVVTSETIPKEARNALDGILKRNRLDKITDFIYGDKLWELIEQYLPSWTALEKVQQAQAVFEEVSPNYRITVTTEGGVPVYSFEEKHPGAAEVEPVEISMQCQFPQTPEGQQRLQAMEQHIKAGAPVTLEGSYIKELTLPPFLRAMFDPEQLAKGILSINPQRSPRPMLVRVAVENDGGHVAFDYIELYVTQAGMEEATFDNMAQPVPWKITLVLDLKEQRMHFRYHMNAAGVNVRQVLEGFRFQEGMAKGGVLKIQDLETGFDIQQTTISPGTFEGPAPGWFRLTERLVFIQTKAQVALRMPSDRPTRHEIEALSIVVQKLTVGEIAVQAITVDLDAESARGAIERFRDGHPLETAPLEETVELCGATISMGPVTARCGRARIAEEDLDALNCAIANAEKGGTVHIRLVPCQGYAMVARYEKWLPDEIRS